MLLFTSFLMLLLYLLFAFVLYFACLYIVKNDENKDVQILDTIRQSHYISNNISAFF